MAGQGSDLAVLSDLPHILGQAAGQQHQLVINVTNRRVHFISSCTSQGKSCTHIHSSFGSHSAPFLPQLNSPLPVMPLKSDLTIASEKLDPKSIPQKTHDFNDSLIKIMEGGPKWYEVCSTDCHSSAIRD